METQERRQTHDTKAKARRCAVAGRPGFGWAEAGGAGWVVHSGMFAGGDIVTEFEVIQSYRQAKDKNKQIGILADLAGTDKQGIIKILMEAGEVTGVKMQKKVPTPKKSKVEWTPELTADLLRMHDAGLKNIEIAERLGVDRKAVANKLNRLRASETAVNITDTKQTAKADNTVLRDKFEKLLAIFDCLCAIEFDRMNDCQNIAYLVSEAYLCVGEMQDIVFPDIRVPVRVKKEPSVKG